MDRRISTWVRVLLVVLAVPQVVTGLWAVLAPENWYERFPGVDPRLVSAEPPFNRHLASDAGAGFLATGVALAIAAVWGRRDVTVVAVVTYLAFAVPHLVYHWANPAPGLTSGEDVLNVALLATGVIAAVVVGWGVAARTRRAGAPQR